MILLLLLDPDPLDDFFVHVHPEQSSGILLLNGLLGFFHNFGALASRRPDGLPRKVFRTRTRCRARSPLRGYGVLFEYTRKKFYFFHQVLQPLKPNDITRIPRGLHSPVDDRLCHDLYHNLVLNHCLSFRANCQLQRIHSY